MSSGGFYVWKWSRLGGVIPNTESKFIGSNNMDKWRYNLKVQIQMLKGKVIGKWVFCILIVFYGNWVYFILCLAKQLGRVTIWSLLKGVCVNQCNVQHNISLNSSGEYNVDKDTEKYMVQCKRKWGYVLG